MLYIDCVPFSICGDHVRMRQHLHLVCSFQSALVAQCLAERVSAMSGDVCIQAFSPAGHAVASEKLNNLTETMPHSWHVLVVYQCALLSDDLLSCQRPHTLWLAIAWNHTRAVNGLDVPSILCNFTLTCHKHACANISVIKHTNDHTVSSECLSKVLAMITMSS